MKTFDADAQLAQAARDLEIIKNETDLALVKARFLGKASPIQKELSALSSLEGEERATRGKLANTTKKSLEKLLADKLGHLLEAKQYDPVDITEPGERKLAGYGHSHPTSLVLAETYRVFTELGFAIVDSPEIETDWYNFEALNMPASHPARDMQDTFYIAQKGSEGESLLPRTHTSGMQVRFMEQNKPPFKIIVPGRVFRNENEDATHSWIFNQVEGLVVGEGVSMSDLKGTLLHVVRHLLGPEADIRFRASYFPYTEPSVELDAKYQGKWLELGGAGMVHSDVLRKGNIDPDQYSGFAFGWGAERIAVIKYGLNDLRQLWRPKFRYLEQF